MDETFDEEIDYFSDTIKAVDTLIREIPFSGQRYDKLKDLFREVNKELAKQLSNLV